MGIGEDVPPVSFFLYSFRQLGLGFLSQKAEGLFPLWVDC
jgi:hypothetical protein